MHDKRRSARVPQEIGRTEEETLSRPRADGEGEGLPPHRTSDEEYAEKMARLLERAAEQQRNQQQQ